MREASDRGLLKADTGGGQADNYLRSSPDRGGPEGDDDRGMLSGFDAEFNSGAALTDNDMDEEDIAEINEDQAMAFGQRAKVLGQDAPRRFSNYGALYSGVLAPLPVNEPMTAAQESAKKRKDYARAYKKTHYLDEYGQRLKPSDPRTRGEGQEPLPKKPGFFSRLGSGISNWWRGSTLNWSNWGRKRQR
jgi:hypothetical protein